MHGTKSAPTIPAFADLLATFNFLFRSVFLLYASKSYSNVLHYSGLFVGSKYLPELILRLSLALQLISMGSKFF